MTQYNVKSPIYTGTKKGMVKVSLVKNVIFAEKKFLVVDGIAPLYTALSPTELPTNPDRGEIGQGKVRYDKGKAR